MERGQRMCDISNCGRLAVSFGMKGAQKTTSCVEHLALLTEKNMQIFNIAGYDFISTVYDAAALEERRNLVAAGRGSVEALTATCESEAQVALRTIESVKNAVVMAVQHRFEEMKAAVTLACDETKRQLAQLENEFKRFLTSKDYELSPTAELACSGLAAPRVIRFAVADTSDSVSAVLSDSWTMGAVDIHSTLTVWNKSQKTEAIESALAEAADFALKGIPEPLQFVDALVGDGRSFDHAKEQVILEILRTEKARNERNLKWLKRSWDLRQQYPVPDEVTVSVGRKLAPLLSRQCGLFSEAEAMLRCCYCIVSSHSLLPHDSMSLCNAICGVFFDCGKHQEAEQLAIWTLDNFAAADLPAELYWTALLHLTVSQQSKDSTLAGRQQRDSRSPLARMLRLLTCGIEAHFDERRQEAESSLLQARRIGISHFPTSLFTALALSFLGLLAEGSAREQYHRQAQLRLDVVAPGSIHSAKNLGSLGDYYASLGRWDDAERCYKQAQSTLEVAFPKSTSEGINMMSLGHLYQEVKRLSEAEACCLQAQSIFGTADSVHAARNLCTLGTVYKETHRLEASEECYIRARSIFRAVAPDSVEEAINEMKLGVLAQETNRLKDAGKCYEKAKFTFDRASPKSLHAAENLENLGNLYKATGQWNEAELALSQARSILEVVAPTSMREAICIVHLGDLFQETEKLIHARSCYLQAQSILDAADPQAINAAVKLSSLGNLHMRKKQWSEAKRCYKHVRAILRVAAPKSVFAGENLSNLGYLCKKRKKWDSAQKYYIEAVSILDAVPISIQAARNMTSFGRFYKKRRNWRDAEKCFVQAKSIFAAIAPRSIHAAINLANLGVLHRGARKWGEVERCYSQALCIYQDAEAESVEAASDINHLQKLIETLRRYLRARGGDTTARPTDE